mmetsp:Transcript_25736/g.68087  ORF Transcript_25736/g.68087 Transcript_25736/m.68087 type:complete len:256 (+) Transcript_25736:460-1227(+)
MAGDMARAMAREYGRDRSRHGFSLAHPSSCGGGRRLKRPCPKQALVVLAARACRSWRGACWTRGPCSRRARATRAERHRAWEQRAAQLAPRAARDPVHVPQSAGQVKKISPLPPGASSANRQPSSCRRRAAYHQSRRHRMRSMSADPGELAPARAAAGWRWAVARLVARRGREAAREVARSVDPSSGAGGQSRRRRRRGRRCPASGARATWPGSSASRRQGRAVARSRAGARMSRAPWCSWSAAKRPTAPREPRP